MKTIVNIAALFFLLPLAAQDQWVVPDAASKKTSPFVFDKTTVDKGRELYQKNCVQCHGDPGKANFVLLNPSPGDPAGEKFSAETDGALFYKISTGRGAMLAFKDNFTEEERWDIISFFRSFHKNYVQPPTGVVVQKPKAWIILRADSAKRLLFVRVRGVRKNDTIAVKKAEATLYLKRYFGNLKLNAAKTDSSGSVVFAVPLDLTGDATGNIELVVKISDDEQFGDFRNSITVTMGQPMTKPSLTDQRAIWGVMSKAPVWLYFLYGSVVAVVWGGIFHILFGMYKIYRLGNEKKKEDHE